MWWKFTWNHYPDDHLQILHQYDELLAGRAFDREIAPTTGTPHLQGFVQFRAKDRPSKLTASWNVHHVWCEKAGGPTVKQTPRKEGDYVGYCRSANTRKNQSASRDLRCLAGHMPLHASSTDIAFLERRQAWK